MSSSNMKEIINDITGIKMTTLNVDEKLLKPLTKIRKSDFTALTENQNRHDESGF